MRGIEFVLGGILLVSGLALPTHPAIVNNVDIDGVSGEAILDRWTHKGNALLETGDAALRAEGPIQAVWHGDAVFEVWECKASGQNISLPIIAWNRENRSCSMIDQIDHRGARVVVTGSRSTLFTLWPLSEGDSRFQLELANTTDTSIHPSRFTSPLGTGGKHNHVLGAPLFALGHNGSSHRALQMSDGSFERLSATGTLRAIVYGDTTVESRNTTSALIFHTWNRYSDRIGTGQFEAFTGDRSGFVVIDFHSVSSDFDFHGTNTVFATREATWTIDGDVDFFAKEGELDAGGASHDLTGKPVKVTGRTELVTSLLGPDGLEQNHDGMVTGSFFSPSESEIQATIEGDSDAVRVGTETVYTRPFAVAATETQDITLAAKLLGTVLLVLGLVRGAFLGIFSLVAQHPLRNSRRRAIYSIIKRRGLSHLSEIQRETGIPFGSLVYHLDILRKGKVVTGVRHRRYTVYFLAIPGFSREDLRRLSTLADPTRRDICESLRDTDGLSQKELARRTGMSRSSISRQLATLKREGLVERDCSRNAIYRTSTLLARWTDLQTD